jgi:hypothetical protein
MVSSLEPFVGSVPLQPTDASHDSNSCELQVSVIVLPTIAEEALLANESWGSTV